MEKKMSYMEKVEDSKVHKALSLVASIGAINWGLIGLLDFNLVTHLFGNSNTAKTAYCLIGAAGIYGFISHFQEYLNK